MEKVPSKQAFLENFEKIGHFLINNNFFGTFYLSSKIIVPIKGLVPSIKVKQEKLQGEESGQGRIGVAAVSA